MTPIFRQIALPNNIRNFKIQDNIPNTAQIVEIVFKTPFYHATPSNTSTPRVNRTVIDFYANNNISSRMFPILLGRSGVCGSNLIVTSPTNIQIIGYYFLWSLSTQYPLYTDFGLIDITSNSTIYTNQQTQDNVSLYWSNVDIWDLFNEESTEYREVFFKEVGFVAPWVGGSLH